MKTLYPVALAALVVGCHIDKLLNGGGGKTPPSEAPPARVAFSSSLSSARAGEPISPPVQVTVQDSAGRVTLRDTLVTLSLGANPSGDSLRGTKQVRSVNGVATFANVRLDKAASGYTLTAAAPELHPDTSGAFSVMPAPATELAFTAQPSAAMQDSAIKPPVKITAYDSLGNVATNFTGAITLTLGANPGGGTLSGGAPVNAVNGVATFPGLSIDKAGTGYTLRATASGLTTGTSGAFDITAAPPTTGDLTVTTSTTGTSPDPDGYTFAVDGGNSQAIGINASVTVNGLAAGSHTVVLSGIAGNCTVSGGTSRTVTVTAGQAVTATFTVSCPSPPPTTGDLTVTTATSGASPDPDGYTFAVDGGSSQAIGINASVTVNGLTAGSHTVVLSGIAGNCTVSGGASRTVTVTAGQTVTATFTVSCPTPPPPTGSLTVTTSTSGGTPDPDGYTFTVDGGSSQAIGINASVTVNGLTAGSHTVVLSGIAANCSVSGGTSQTVTVTAGQTVTATFTVSCPTPPPPTGSLTVTTSTSGGTPDPDGYSFAVDGGSSQAIGINASATVNGLTAGSHTVVLSGLAANCSVSGGTSRTVTVTAGQTVTATFTVSCPTPPPPNQPPSVSAGSDQTVLVGALFTLTGAGFSDPDHDGPWTVTIDWGDGTSSTSTSPGEGSIGGSHSYPVTLLPHDYQLTVTVVDAHGGRGSATKTVHVVLS